LKGKVWGGDSLPIPYPSRAPTTTKFWLRHWASHQFIQTQPLFSEHFMLLE